jgi:hypothetical protein
MSNVTQGQTTGKLPVDGQDIQPSGIAAGSVILTLEGALPIEFLSVGDRIITRNGARILRSITSRVARNAPMVRICASALGHDRPEEDLIVAPGQPIHIRDWRALALFGAKAVSVPAARIVDGEYVRRETIAEQRLFMLGFDATEVIYANDLELACAPATVNA